MLVTTSNPTDLLSFSNSQRQLIVPLPSSFWVSHCVDLDNKWLVRCLPVKAFAADQPQAHVQVLWPPNQRQSTRVQIDSESKNRLCCVLKMSPNCSPQCCNIDPAKLSAITTITQPSSGGRSHLHLRARTRNLHKEHRLRARSCKAFALLQSTSKSTTLCAVVPKHDRQQENKSPQKIDTRAVHVAHFQSSSSKLHHSPTFS